MSAPDCYRGRSVLPPNILWKRRGQTRGELSAHDRILDARSPHGADGAALSKIGKLILMQLISNIKTWIHKNGELTPFRSIFISLHFVTVWMDHILYSLISLYSYCIYQHLFFFLGKLDQSIGVLRIAEIQEHTFTATGYFSIFSIFVTFSAISGSLDTGFGSRFRGANGTVFRPISGKACGSYGAVCTQPIDTSRSNQKYIEKKSPKGTRLWAEKALGWLDCQSRMERRHGRA